MFSSHDISKMSMICLISLVSAGCVGVGEDDGASEVAAPAESDGSGVQVATGSVEGAGVSEIAGSAESDGSGVQAATGSVEGAGVSEIAGSVEFDGSGV